MLYNQSWEQPKKDIWSLDNLISWLETKSGRYNYANCYECLLAQYFIAMGKRDVRIGNTTTVLDGEDFLLPKGWNVIAGYGFYDNYWALPQSHSEWTFEKALKRAKALRGDPIENTSEPKHSLLGRIVAACSL